MNIEGIVSSGLCMQCGTCAGVCPQRAILMDWSLRGGWLPIVDSKACSDCSICVRDCPGMGYDFSPDASWRKQNSGAPCRDFLGPYRGVWVGWSTDEHVRYSGASGGVATAILQGALAAGEIDAAIVVRMSHRKPLAAEPMLARTCEEIAAARGSKYNSVASNALLRSAIDMPGRYALVGLPCHIQGLRLAQRHNASLRERMVLALGVFCGWTSLPRATELAARRSGVAPADLISVRYRGPGWPGAMRLQTSAHLVHERAYPDYFDRFMYAWTPSRCRICPDALAETADISVGDAWLDCFQRDPRFRAGVSDVIVRTPAGERLIERLRPRWLTLEATTPREIIASQSETYRCKRDIFRGRLWLRRLAARRLPDYPGVETRASLTDKFVGARNLAEEAWFRSLGDHCYR